MADTKISELTAAGAITGAEIVPLVQGGVTKRSTVTDVIAHTHSTYIPGTVVAETVVGSGGAASVDFTSIAATGRTLLIVAQIRGETTGALVRLRFNNDSAGNYDYVYQSFQGTNGSGDATSAGATFLRVGTCPPSSATAGRASSMQVWVPNYAGTTWHKAITATSSSGIGTTTQEVFQAAGVWNSTAAISRVTITLDAGDLAEGSVITLYRLGGA